MATHLENLEKREKSGNLRVVREKSWKKGEVGEKSGKVCCCIWSITASVDLAQNVQKRNYFLGKVLHHMKAHRRKDAYSARCKLCLKTFLLSNMGKQTVVSHAKSSGHVWNVVEKSGNLIVTGEWPLWYYTVSPKKLCQCYFVNNSVKHWPNLIIFGMQHREETRHKRPQFCPSNFNTVATLPCEMQKSCFGR